VKLEMRSKFYSGRIKGKDQSGDKDVDGKIILKVILEV
jgi:hypothetical protein